MNSLIIPGDTVLLHHYTYEQDLPTSWIRG